VRCLDRAISCEFTTIHRSKSVEVDEQVCIRGQSVAVARSTASENKLFDPC
jgi:hypothetical protein